MPSFSLPARTDVVIVGAGPTGLALAASLARDGVDHLLIDKRESPQTTSRAAVIHAHTLEALEPFGVVSRLCQAGLKLSRFSLRDAGRTLVRLRFDELPTAFPYLLMLPQDVTEATLTDALEDFGGCVRRGVGAEEVEPTPEGVRVWLNAGDGVVRSVDARYVVGADGMHSTVREQAGIEFDGDSDPHSFILADVRMDWPEGRDEVTLFFTQEGPLVIAPLPDGGFRVVAAMAQAPEHPSLAEIAALIDSYGPGAAARITGIVWSSRFRIHHRLARTYQKERVLIMGDAAHVHSPAGGQGMNTGLVDATVLGRLLADAMAGRRPESDLALYETLRRPAAAKVMRLAGQLTEMATAKSSFARALRNTQLKVAGHVPAVRRKFEMNLSGLSRRAAAQLPPPVRAPEA